jgi:hypothetical protein
MQNYSFMKRILLLALFICANLMIYAQYLTPGTGVNWTFNDLVQQSGGVVTFQDGFFTVNQNLTVSLNDTLQLTENHTIKLNQNVLLTVKGTLIADAPQQAVFTASNPALYFRGFRFENSHASVLRNCLIEYGGGIQIIGSQMTVEACTIRYFNRANTTGALQISQGRTWIINNEIHENKGPAIASASNGQAVPQIYNNTIWSNNTDNTNAPQINLGSAAGDTIRIIGNTITGQYDNAGGIAVSTLVGGGCFVIVEDNLVENNRYGYAAIGSNIQSRIFNNHLVDNNIQGVPNLGGSGLNFNGGATNTAIVSGNIISGNLWGVTIQGQAMPNLGDINSPERPGGNHLFDNGNSGQLYALYNNTPQNQMAQNNYWGFTSIDSVEMVIFHQPDDPTLGFVNYTPILNPILAGDANCDGNVNVVDIITIANYIMGQNPEPFCFENADVNQDGSITVMDIIGTANIIMGEARRTDSKEFKKE